MKKKNYNQPTMEVAVLAPMTIICASITFGGDASQDITGD